MTGRGVGTVDSVAHNFSDVASPSGWAVWSPVISSYMDPLGSTCLASDLQKTLMQNNLSPPGYRHMRAISSTP